MDKYIKASELYKKIAETFNRGRLSWGANEIFKDIIGECEPANYKGEWIPIKIGIDDYGEEVLICPLPDDGQEVLISYSGNVYIDTFWNDDGNYFEDFDINEVDAWQPLPKPYKKGAAE